MRKMVMQGKNNMGSVPIFYISKTGRYTQTDPIGLGGGDVNLMRYVGNSPNNFMDPLGLWPTKIHNKLIRSFVKTYLPSLSPDNIEAIQEGSRYVDTFQDPKYSYMHHMRDATKNQSIEDAERRMSEFIRYHLRNYKCNLAKKNYYEAYKELGMALHPVMDSTAPPHADFQPWMGIVPLLNSAIHGAGEQSNSNKQIQITVDRMIKTLEGR